MPGPMNKSISIKAHPQAVQKNLVAGYRTDGFRIYLAAQRVKTIKNNPYIAVVGQNNFPRITVIVDVPTPTTSAS